MSFGHDLTRDTNFATSRQEPSLGLTAPRSLLAYDSRDGGARSVGGEAGGAQFLWAADARADPGRYCGGPESRRSGAPRPLLRHGQARPEPAIRSAESPLTAHRPGHRARPSRATEARHPAPGRPRGAARQLPRTATTGDGSLRADARMSQPRVRDPTHASHFEPRFSIPSRAACGTEPNIF